MGIQAWRERRNGLALQARKLLDDTKSLTWEAEHQRQYDELTAEIMDLDKRIAREQKVLDLMAEKEFRDITHEKEKGGRKVGDEGDQAESMFSRWMRRGEKGLSDQEVQTIYNTMSTGNGNEGGFTVPTTISSQLIESLKAFGGVRKVATVIRTTSGNPLSYPTTDGTNEFGELVPENSPASDSDISFGTINLNVFKYSSKVITVPFELMQDAVINVDDLVIRRAGTRLGRITNSHYINGSGGGQPRGLLTAASVGKIGATGSASTYTVDDLMDMLDSVDQAYLDAGNAKFMASQSARKTLRKLKDTTGRPIWTPNYDAGIAGGFSDQLLGYDLVINNDMPVPSANAKSLLFGDFSYYTIRDAMDISFYRFSDSAYTKRGQVGFLAFLRTGGNLLDSAAVKYYQHSAS